MALKFVLLISCVAIAAAIELQHHKSHEVDYHAPAKYEFSYSVQDKHTGDIKAQKEVRDGDKVEGVYELIDSDGHRRIVHYTADKHSGFQAVVHREPTGIKIPIPEHKHIAPLVHHHSIAPLHSLNLIKSEGSEGHHHQVLYHGSGISHRY